jgi:signal peptidase II
VPGRWAFVLVFVTVGTLVDQWTKAWADAHLPGRGIVPVVEGFLELRYVLNPGAFFGWGGGLPEGARRWVLSAASVAVAGILLRAYARSAPDAHRLRLGLALLLTGALGNLIDRVRHGVVVDFLHLRLGDVFHWATFNVADACIAVGLVCLALEWPRASSARPVGTPRMPVAAREGG